MKANARIQFAIMAACFLASGAAGLIYQVVWSKYLALFLGHSSYAVVAVLVAFMAGLALGNAWFGARADESKRPLAIYAWLEIAIGIYALAFPAYYSFCHDAYLELARSMQPGSSGLLASKFLFSFALILLPTVLMGATFPVLTRFVTRSLAELRDRVAALYAINSLGAVLGCVVADFWWIPHYGLEVTVFGGAGLNLAVGVVAMVISLRTEGARLAQGSEPASLPSQEEAYSPGELRLALAAIGLSGFVAMLYEVAWTRLLALALGSSTHAFSLMLITFIAGIAAGAWIVYLWHGLRQTLVAFAWAEIALAATLFVSLFYYEYLSFWFVRIGALLARQDQAYLIYELLQGAICFGVMFVPAICLGMTLPLVSRVATRELARTGRSVGTVFAINTLGTVLGAVLTGLWLMPQLGLARTFAVGIALNAMIGLAVLTRRHFGGRPGALLVPGLVGLVILWFVGSRLTPAWQRSLSLGLWRVPNPPRTVADFRQMADRVRLRYHKDGAGSTVTVYAYQSGAEENLTLKVNGKADAGTGADMSTQVLLGHIPMLLRPQAKAALVIGLGSGVTCEAVARHPSIERLDAVEISPEVAEVAATHFARFNAQVLANPKVHLTIEDAKSFLKTTDRQYDLITSEPSNPWMAGVAGVFSREYYESCAARLQPDGIVAQWIHVYETTDETVHMVLRTFLSVFPYMSVWQAAAGDLVLVGSKRPITVDLEAAQHRFAEPGVQSDLARVEILSLATVLAREMIPQQNGLFIVPPEGPIHSDFFPQLEYLAQRGFFLNRLAEQWTQYREDFSPRATTWLGLYLQKHPLTEDDFKAFVRDYQVHRFPDATLFRSLLQRWQGDSTKPAFPVDLWAIASDRIPAAELRALRLAPLQEAMAKDAASNPVPLRLYVADLMDSYRAQRSVFNLPSSAELERLLPRLVETDAAHQRVHKLHLAELAWDRGDDARCLELGQSALNPDVEKGGAIDFSPDRQAPYAVLYRMIETFWRGGRVADAWALCQQANSGGYLAGAPSYFPLLEVVYRRVETAVGPRAPNL